ncbi:MULTISPECIES: LPS export ABC transporter periplasmic protein LptC [Pseudomonas]|jgi:lipopolysaccharide export system protein LptC|uniref:LPS export ABC transporter periplasmic protein LptC n=1 Tax=Pseudomonas TaxID=286 RepID=UPI00084A79B9|nr:MULTISPECIES: LPS export ABC transporter periplasmic protein LptC [Pseudomonas]MEA3170271.1 lipopolysaccharide export system protein LptC [Pseudomonas sp.]MBC8784831.1 LPS export ABC transporter periplasmic protein LptC [Pseudomonas fluorescens]MBK5545379.1 LPS export ABC transporter periplasmic protein LptC [Pseudomonas sp. TH04]MDD5444005.1 LPS export ABC transporter periplasmic protein LptC [Pseudomonas fluorescens]NNB70358.1 LPS export ABC transporter periplasmic protein LptC [Pseudomon
MLSKKIRNFLLFGVIAALFLAVGYWNISPERFLDKPVVAVDDSAIAYYALNAHTIQFLPDGKVQYEMTADKVENLKATDVSLLTNPDLNLYKGTDYPWHVTSKRGEVNSDGTQVELIDSVRVARTDEKKRDTIITSSRMTVFPQQQYAQTEQDVRIDGAGGVSTGKGMKAYLKESRIHLLSNVRGQYEAR